MQADRYMTYQGLQSKFVWLGMCTAAAYKYAEFCTLCQLYAPKAPAAPIQGHVQADECAQVVTADIVHMPDANGNKYMLTVMDILSFSRYGGSVPLTAVTALEVTIALRDMILPNGWGRLEMWVLDGGSEFKAELTEALEAWDTHWRESAPGHPQSHGAIERYNMQDALRQDCDDDGRTTDGELVRGKGGNSGINEAVSVRSNIRCRSTSNTF